MKSKTTKAAGKTNLDPLVRLTPRYSGENSHDFWCRVNAMKGKDRDTAYSMGVALQNLEYSVLQFIEIIDGKMNKAMPNQISGFMRGNHSFLTWDSPKKARQAILDGLHEDDARLFEMAFTGVGGGPVLHRKPHELTADFLVRSESFFRECCVQNCAVRILQKHLKEKNERKGY